MSTPISWPEAQRICDIPEVREALDKFAADAHDENMLAMVSAIMGARPDSQNDYAALEGVNDGEWEDLAIALCKEEGGDPFKLTWTGGAVPEPWGDAWMHYQGDAQRMIALVRKHVPVRALFPEEASPSIESDVDFAITVLKGVDAPGADTAIQWLAGLERDITRRCNASWGAGHKDGRELERLTNGTFTQGRAAGLEEAARVVTDYDSARQIRAISPNPSDAGKDDALDEELAELIAIGKNLLTQDNRYTDQPLFIVEQKRLIVGIDTEYANNIGWFDSDGMATAEEHEFLEKQYKKSRREPDGWTRTGYSEEWQFVTACFTEQGCKDYIRIDGHNLKEPRIYADGSYRNNEYRTVRNFLMQLAAKNDAALSSLEVIGKGERG